MLMSISLLSYQRQTNASSALELIVEKFSGVSFFLLKLFLLLIGFNLVSQMALHCFLLCVTNVKIVTVIAASFMHFDTQKYPS